MRIWQKDALSIIREARTYATLTSNEHLSLACKRAIQVMIREGCQVPSELRTYAYQNPQSLALKITDQTPLSPTQLAD